MNGIIIELYVRLINEYYSIMTQSDIIKQIENKRFIMYVGLNSINNIFKINLITTKNIQITYYYCEKACYCYLEYIEQINKTEALNNLNINDVVTFVYKENITYNDDKNIVQLTNTHFSNISNTENLNSLFNILTSISIILLNWNNDNIDETIHTIICQKYFLKYMYLFSEKNMNEYIDYLETILEKIKMNKDIYFDFLEQFYKKIKNKKTAHNGYEIKNKVVIFMHDYNNDKCKISDIKQFIKTYI